MLETPNQLTVEAETVEAALAEISTEFGENAEIMRAQKVHRGGVGGFFAKEMVQLTARRRTDEPAPLRPAGRRPVPSGGGITDVLERMAQDADAEDSDFRTVLQRELATESATETAPESFLAAVGWEDGVQDVAKPATEESAGDAEVIENTFADELPEPIAVGPALQAAAELEPVPVEAPAMSEREEVLAVATEGPIVVFPDSDEGGFDDAASLDPEPAVAVPTEVEVDMATAAKPEDRDTWREAARIDAPPGMGAVSWSTTALLRLGLPGPVISAVADLSESDDLSWIDRIAETVAPHCGPLPTDDVIVVGPHAERLAEPLGLPLVRAGDMAPYDGSFCAMVDDNPDDRRWLEFVRGGRGIHLVVGDDPWQDLLIDEPVAVSWVGENAVASALYLAFTLGATLGFGTVDGFVSTMVRAQPTDVALAVRRIVGRR